MLTARSENDTLTDRRTDVQTDGQTLECNFLSGEYNIIPHTF